MDFLLFNNYNMMISDMGVRCTNALCNLKHSWSAHILVPPPHEGCVFCIIVTSCCECRSWPQCRSCTQNDRNWPWHHWDVFLVNKTSFVIVGHDSQNRSHTKCLKLTWNMSGTMWDVLLVRRSLFCVSRSWPHKVDHATKWQKFTNWKQFTQTLTPIMPETMVGCVPCK